MPSKDIDKLGFPLLKKSELQIDFAMPAIQLCIAAGDIAGFIGFRIKRKKVGQVGWHQGNGATQFHLPVLVAPPVRGRKAYKVSSLASTEAPWIPLLSRFQAVKVIAKDLGT